jgi:hypothetical protein
MSDDRYKQIFEDLTRDLLAVAKRHGKRALREAVRDAAHGNLLQEEEDIPPEELDYPDEDVWTLPPAPEDEDEGEETDKDTEENELSKAAERVASELEEKLRRRLRK